MADKVLCEKSDLVAVANAIRSKNGTTNKYKVNQLAGAVENISSGTTLPTLSNNVSWANEIDIQKCNECIDFIQNLDEEEFGKFISGLYFNISKIEKGDIELVITNNGNFIETAEFYEYVDNYLYPIDWDYIGEGLYCIYTPNRNPLVITVRE